MAENKLGKNIRNLRKSYGETQFELALAIGVDSPNTIGNYEKGIRVPQPEIRKKIAAHYRITEDELVNSTFSGRRIKVTGLDNPELLHEMTLAMLPMVKSEEALSHENFKKGYEAHQRAYQVMKDKQVYPEKDFELCIDYYYDACEKDDTPEAAVNLLWWFMLLEIAMKNQWVLKGTEALLNHQIKGKEFMKTVILRDMSNQEEDTNENELADEVLEIDEAIIDILKELKGYTEWRDLVDYYIALRYVTGCISNGLSEDLNRTVGCEMLDTLVEFGNTYAKNFMVSSMKNLS